MSERNYDDPIYKEARIKTLKRDGFKCQWPNCGCSKRLRVHHIRTWAEHPALRYELGNLITLCREHHDFIWGREDDYATMFFQLIKRQKDGSRPQKQTTSRGNKNNKGKKRKKRAAKTYAQKYAEAKRKVRRRKR